MKDKYIKAYMRMAKEFAKTSEAVRMKVGALIVHPEEGVVSEGVNGMPPHWPTEVCEFKETDEGGLFEYLVTKPECRHAEIAALEKLWMKPNSSKGCYIFVTMQPCYNCAIKIHTAGITKVFYEQDYRLKDGVKYLEGKGIEVIQVEQED